MDLQIKADLFSAFHSITSIIMLTQKEWHSPVQNFTGNSQDNEHLSKPLQNCDVGQHIIKHAFYNYHILLHYTVNI